jgi:SAM-dependent methyltransferase
MESEGIERKRNFYIGGIAVGRGVLAAYGSLFTYPLATYSSLDKASKHSFFKEQQMGSAKVQGDLWGQAPLDWANLQEPKHIPLFEAMLDAARVGEGTRLLDAGCGGGGASRLAAGRGARVTGLDAASGLIEVARERVPSGDFRVGDIEELPFEDDVFDVVLAANSVQYAADHVAALRELGRVCAPEGQIVVGLFGTPDKVEFRAILQAVREALPEPPPGGRTVWGFCTGQTGGADREGRVEGAGKQRGELPVHLPGF